MSFFSLCTKTSMPFFCHIIWILWILPGLNVISSQLFLLAWPKCNRGLFMNTTYMTFHTPVKNNNNRILPLSLLLWQIALAVLFGQLECIYWLKNHHLHFLRRRTNDTVKGWIEWTLSHWKKQKHSRETL